MKRLLLLLVVFVMLFSIAGCNSKAEEEANTPEKTKETSKDGAEDTSAAENMVKIEGMLWEVEPLPEKTKLRVAYIGSTSPPLTTYIAMEKKWLDAVNLELELILFPNGPAQMEASSAWDCASTGIGGVITGVIGHDLKVLATAARDEGGHQAFFARKDSPIVKAGKGHTSIPELYGTAEAWKGKDILCAIGTTNHYVLYKTLDAFGLDTKDVNVINMDIATANTAFLAGQGDVVGVWGPLLYNEDKKDLVMVSNDAWVKTGIVTNYIASSGGWKEKQAAIEKWLEVTIMGGEWAMQNIEEAAQYMVEMNELDGYPTELEDNIEIIEDNPFATLEDNYNYYTKKSEDGKMLDAKAQAYNPMSVFVKMGKYSKEQLDALGAGENFLPEPIINIYNRVNNK